MMENWLFPAAAYAINITRSFPSLSIFAVKGRNNDKKTGPISILFDLIYSLWSCRTNEFQMDIYGLKCAVSLGGASVANGTAKKTRASINAEGQTDLNIRIGVNFLKIGQAVGTLIKDQSAPYEISGTMIFSTPVRSEKQVPFSRAGAVSMMDDY